MDYIGMAPTAADYANSNAQDAKREVRNLKERVYCLERVAAVLCSIVREKTGVSVGELEADLRANLNKETLSRSAKTRKRRVYKGQTAISIAAKEATNKAHWVRPSNKNKIGLAD